MSSDPENSRKLLDQVRDAIRLKHYSIRTEDAYADWIKRFILFHNKRHPAEMGAPEITAFLTHLAVHDQVASSTQNQALNALDQLRNSCRLICGATQGPAHAKTGDHHARPQV